MGRLNVYYHPNIDGRHSAMVAAANQTEACRLLHCSVGDFCRYGGRRLGPADSRHAVAMSEPGRVWKQKIDHTNTPQPWMHAHPEQRP